MKDRKNKNMPMMLRAMRWLFPKLERWSPFIAQRIFRLVFYVPLTYRIPEKEREAEKSAQLFAIVVEGKKIQCYSWGEASRPYVMVAHGWAGRATQFRKFIGPLQEAGYRMVGFDGPAHGKSEGMKTSILEFEKVFQALFQKLGAPAAVITHSFGGAAVLYAIMNGLPVKKLINIASPSMEDEILKTYLRAINGSWVSAERFKDYVLKSTGKTFDQFTARYAIQRLPHAIDFLMVQDADDEEVLMVHAEELLKAYPSAKLFKTSGLGHNRVLKDEQVIQACVQFIKV